MHQQFNIGTAMNESFRVWLKNLPSFTLLAFGCLLPTLVLTLIFGDAEGSLDANPQAAGLISLLSFCLTTLITGVITYGTVQHLRGQKTPIGKSMSVGLARLFPLLATSFLVGLAIMVGLFLLVVPGIIIALMFLVAAPAIVVEKQGVMGSMKRSKELTSGYKWSLLGLILVTLLLVIGVSFAGGMVIGVISIASSHLAVVLISVLEAAGLTFYSVVSAVTYYQLRQVKEGTSLDELAAVFD